MSVPNGKSTKAVKTITENLVISIYYFDYTIERTFVFKVDITKVP